MKRRFTYGNAEKNIGQRIKYRRNEKGISQRDLADLIQRNVSAVCKMEAGESSPSFIQVALIADALECSLDWIAGTDDAKDPKDPYQGLPNIQRMVLTELNQLPYKVQGEVLKYVRYLVWKQEQRRIEKEKGVDLNEEGTDE